MTPERFTELADAYGGDIARWPSHCREDALRFAAGGGRAVLADAARLDALLDAAPRVAMSPALRERMLAAAPRAAAPRPAWRWGAGVGAAMAVACAAGVAAGAFVAPADVIGSARAALGGDDAGLLTAELPDLGDTQ